MSSAFVERVFSQLAFIRRVAGDSASRDVLELRTLIRVNNGLMEDSVPRTKFILLED